MKLTEAYWTLNDLKGWQQRQKKSAKKPFPVGIWKLYRSLRRGDDFEASAGNILRTAVEPFTYP